MASYIIEATMRNANGFYSIKFKEIELRTLENLKDRFSNHELDFMFSIFNPLTESELLQHIATTLFRRSSSSEF